MQGEWYSIDGVKDRFTYREDEVNQFDSWKCGFEDQWGTNWTF